MDILSSILFMVTFLSVHVIASPCIFSTEDHSFDLSIINHALKWEHNEIQLTFDACQPVPCTPFDDTSVCKSQHHQNTSLGTISDVSAESMDFGLRLSYSASRIDCHCSEEKQSLITNVTLSTDSTSVITALSPFCCGKPEEFKLLGLSKTIWIIVVVSAISVVGLIWYYKRSKSNPYSGITSTQYVYMLDEML
ncbi:hypothetical protein P9112_012935 [Eukaryota sp. TZLM1-RC]